MKIANMDKAEDLIKEHRRYEQFYNNMNEYIVEALEECGTNPEDDVEITLQGHGPRRTTKQITIWYGDPLFDMILETIESKMNKIKDELSEL